jgi:hypothetical protein
VDRLDTSAKIFPKVGLERLNQIAEQLLVARSLEEMDLR